MFISNSKYKRLNLYGGHLIIAANPNPPMFYGEYDPTTGHFKATHGIDVSFISMMANYFNFSYAIADQHGQWGLEPAEDGSYDGLLGSVISGNATFGIGAVSIRLHFGKEHLIEFTTPNLATRITFLMLESPRVVPAGVLLRPLTFANWTIFLSLLLIVLLTGRLITFVTRSPVDLDWHALGAFLQKAPRLRTSNHQYIATHCLLQISWFGGFICLAAYGGVLISFLTRSFKPGNINNLSDFNVHLRERRIIPLLVGTSTFVHDFKRYANKSRTFTNILTHMEEVSTYHEGFFKIIRDKSDHPELNYALIGQYMVMAKWAEHLGGQQFFHLQYTADASIFTDNYGLVFKFGSNLTVHFDRFIRIATEAGFFVRWSSQKYKWTSNWTTKVDIKTTKDEAADLFDYETHDSPFSYDQLELVHVHEHFFLLGLGAGFGVISLMAEIGFIFWKAT